MRIRPHILSLTAAFGCTVLIGAPASSSSQVDDRTGTSSHAAPAPENRVDINHASLDELLKIPGMTRTWATRIVRFRPYRSKQDLLDRGIVTADIYERIKDYVIAHRGKQT